MSEGFIQDPVFTVLGKALDAYSLRHRSAAENIANANTPGYKRSYVPFEGELARALEEGEEELSRLSPRPVRDWLTQAREDGNNVDMEQEVAEMAKNNLRYQAASSVLRTRFSMYRYVISEGKR
ncbi:MAG: flagellar basal body rod protein FlgB [Candidatus Geothermincolales bacterium]